MKPSQECAMCKKFDVKIKSNDYSILELKRKLDIVDCKQKKLLITKDIEGKMANNANFEKLKQKFNCK